MRLSSGVGKARERRLLVASWACGFQHPSCPKLDGIVESEHPGQV